MVGAERFNSFFQERLDETEAIDPDENRYWLQRWIAVAETIGISKKQLLQDYYYDEFLVVLDEYNELHKIDSSEKIEQVSAEDW